MAPIPLLPSGDYLEDFLFRIGADSISPIPPTDLKPTITPRLDAIDDEINKLENTVHGLVIDSLPLIKSQAATAFRINEELVSLDQTVSKTEREIYGPQQGHLPQLISRLRSHSELSASHSLTQSNLFLLRSLFSITSSLNRLQALITKDGDLYSAVLLLFELEVRLGLGTMTDSSTRVGFRGDSAAGDVVAAGTEIWGTLQSRARELRALLEDTLVECWKQAYVVNSDDGIGTGVTAHLSVADTIEAFPTTSKHTPLSSLIHAFSTLRRPSLDSHLNQLSKDILKHIVDPLLRHSTGPAFGIRVVRTPQTVQKPSGYCVQLYELGKGSEPSVVESLTTLVDFLSRQLLPDSSPRSIPLTSPSNQRRPSQFFPLLFTPPFQSAITQTFLSSSLPSTFLPPHSTLTNIRQFETTVDQAVALENHLIEIGYLVVQDPQDQETFVIRRWKSGLGLHWARKYAKEVAERCRDLVVSNQGGEDGWTAMEVDFPVDWEGESDEDILMEDARSDKEWDGIEEEQGDELKRHPTITLNTTEIKTMPNSTNGLISSPTVSVKITSPTEEMKETTKKAPPTPLQLVPTMDANLPETSPNQDEEDDGWGFDDDDPLKDLGEEEDETPALKPEPASTLKDPLPAATEKTSASPPKTDKRTLPHSDSQLLTPDADDEGEDEDGWGFAGESPPAFRSSPTPEPERPLSSSIDDISLPEAVTSSNHSFTSSSFKTPETQTEAGGEENMDVDAVWGFDDDATSEDTESSQAPSSQSEDNNDLSTTTRPAYPRPRKTSANQRMPVLRSSSISQKTPPLSATLAGSDHGPVTPTTPTSRSNFHGTPSRKGKENRNSHRSGSLGGSWGWDEGDEDEARQGGNSSRKGKGKGRDDGERKDEKLEICLISKKSKAVVDVADGILREALNIENLEFSHPAFTSALSSLLRSFLDVLDIYRATMPIVHSRLLDSVPSLAMQFANDCEWISHSIKKLVLKERGAEDNSWRGENTRNAVRKLRRLGRRFRDKQVAAQKEALLECLDDTNDFRGTTDNEVFAACERAMRQISLTLEQLASSWKPVVTRTYFFKTLGSLVDTVLFRILTDIEDQADISEEDSNRLNHLCKMLHGLESLFYENDQSHVAEYVPIWFKFVYLSEILPASMADVMFLWREGHLVDFSSNEVIRLVRALFSDSPLREKNIQEIVKRESNERR